MCSSDLSKLHAIDPASAGWAWTSLEVHRLRAGDRVASVGAAADGRERLLLVLEGRARVGLDGVEALLREMGADGQLVHIERFPARPAVFGTLRRPLPDTSHESLVHR